MTAPKEQAPALDQRNAAMCDLGTLPEAWRLRDCHWQLFATLTFASPDLSQRTRVTSVFNWLRKIAKHSNVQFARLLWVARFEYGRRTLRGHFHACIAGLPSPNSTPNFCRELKLLWEHRALGFAQVQPYADARDGVGYILKQDARESQTRVDGCEPMLSDSLIAAVRRGRM